MMAGRKRGGVQKMGGVQRMGGVQKMGARKPVKKGGWDSKTYKKGGKWKLPGVVQQGLGWAAMQAKGPIISAISPQIVSQIKKKTGKKVPSAKVKAFLMGLSKEKLNALRKNPLSVVPQIIAALA